MLIEFTVGNFKSFRVKTTFSMIAANLTSDDPALDSDNIISIKKDLRLLKSAAIYGANASGKSNLGVALRFMRDFVLESSRETFANAAIAVEPFLLDKDTRHQPSFFELLFLLNATQYRYGFEVNKSHVVSEWLFRAKAKEACLFKREGQEIEIKAAFKEGQGLQGKTRPNALFLSVAAQFNGNTAETIREWFNTFAVETGLQDDRFRMYTLDCLRDPVQQAEIVSFVQAFDLGIDDVMAANPPPLDDLPQDLPGEVKQRIRKSVGETIYTAHRFGEGVEDLELFNLDKHESHGTRKLIAMAGPLHSILANGQTMFVDELDARLHPLTTRRIIEMFQSPLTNPKGAQLIFATHDTNLLDKSLFRRDQIWFSEKDQKGATHLTSLAEYRVRNDAAFEKNYLEGRYGAIPFLGDLKRLPLAQVGRAEEQETWQEMIHA